MYSSRARSLFSLFALFLTACPPAASCPGNTVLSADGRCVLPGDGGVGYGGVGDGSVGHDAYVGAIDAGLGPDGCALHTYYADADGDGHGNAPMTTFACTMPTGYVTTMDDCNDACAACHPGATEICEGSHDENCDGHVDENCGCTAGMMRACGASSTPPCHMGMQSCVGGTWGACTGNVDPTVETCNGIDDDCNGVVDNGLTIPLWYPDMDHDGHGAGTAVPACTMPSGDVASNDDCDDTSAARFPRNTETCDGVDNDCNAMPDDGLPCVRGAATTCTTVCGSTGTGVCSATCALPTGAACASPLETCNGVDDNCDGVADEGLDALGANVMAAAGPGPIKPVIVALASGYGVLYNSGSSLVWQTVSATGVAGTAVPLGSDTIAGLGIYDARFDGTNVVIAFFGSTGYSVFAIAPNTGARVFPTTPGVTMSLPTPATYTLTLGRMRIVSATPGAASLYVVYAHSGTEILHRWSITTTGVGTVQAGSGDFAADLNLALAWDAVRAGGTDYVAYRTSGGDLRVATASLTSSTGTSVWLVGTAGADTSNQVAVAIADPTMGPSATNPLGIASSNTTNVRVGAYPSGAAQVFVTGAAGTSSGALNPVLRLVAAPDHSTYARRGHWVLVYGEPSGASGNRVRAWEVLTSATMLTTTALGGTVEGYATTRVSVSADTDGMTMRVAELDASGNVVTRPIGCP
jgi:hypothetical protein